MQIEVSVEELVLICEALKVYNTNESETLKTKLGNELIRSMQSKELKEK